MSKRVTIYDIAREAGVSTATVTRALNNKTGISKKMRNQIIDIADSLGYVANFSARALARNPIRMCLLIHNQFPVFHGEIIAGVRNQVDKLKDLNVSCDYYCLEGSEAEVRPQFIQYFDQIIANRPDGVILLVPAQIDTIYSKVTQMTEAGIRVVLINTDLPGNNRVCCCRQDSENAGKIAAELLYKMVPSGKVAVFTGSRNVIDHANSIKGFQSECNRRNMDVVTISENYDDYEFASFNTERLVKEHPEVEGIYINTANSVSVCNKIKALGKEHQIRIIASDVFQEVIEFMHDDIIQATIYQNPFRQGKSAVKVLYRSITENIKSIPDVLIQPQIVLESNLPAFIHSNIE